MDDLASLLEEFAPGVLWLISLVVMLFTAAVAIALSYHWREYTIDAQRSNLMFRGYLTVAGILALIMILAMIFYQDGAY